ncbi:type II secretion system F family protein [Shewanella insulae]|uniref:Type II secretion system F family protein n=1 Tax=Shewanella insulae TaxID=2681496 RepID=A0A6L7I1J8_9GAMM|nr:type II secretion system F family protein [Shewanella insulae]MCG9714537.1 type II secretion system F family protein [Shewanella insulae]MCG9737142.1 type II secretion system F family protein [Shewanella insulae]MCG9756803.1 type II secretion system F family protein [Shewanella insulae]MXR69171.1 type II secretion system F family protein [Shewanella insulae]
MDYLIGLINQVFDDPEHVKWAIYIVAAIVGITLALSISFLISGVYSPVRKRLQHIKGEQGHSGTYEQSEVNKTLEHGIGKLSKLSFLNLSNDETRRLLIHAGLHSDNALAVFSAIRLLLLLIGAALSIVLLQYFNDLSVMISVYLVCLVMGVFFLAPSMILTYMAHKRMRALRVGFPDALDLLVVCCEAGLGLLAALQRVARELSLSHPDLSSELELVCNKIRAGLTVKVALNEFTERTGLEDIKGLNSAISQSIRLGTGIAATLRVFSEEYRDKRLQQAEEQAAKMAVKMIFPMMFCIWPSFFIVAVGPAVLKVMKVWGQAF